MNPGNEDETEIEEAISEYIKSARKFKDIRGIVAVIRGNLMKKLEKKVSEEKLARIGADFDEQTK